MIQHRYRARVKARKVMSELNRTCALAETELQIRFERKRRSKRKQQSRVKREESSRPVGARQVAFEWLQQEQDATLLQEKEDDVAGCPAYPMGARCAIPVAGKDHARERSSRERGRHLRRSTSRLRDEDIGCEGEPSDSRGASSDLPFVSQAILEPPAPQHHISHPGGWHRPRAHVRVHHRQATVTSQSLDQHPPLAISLAALSKPTVLNRLNANLTSETSATQQPHAMQQLEFMQTGMQRRRSRVRVVPRTERMEEAPVELEADGGERMEEAPVERETDGGQRMEEAPVEREADGGLREWKRRQWRGRRMAD